ncbi:MAG: ribosomal protein S18-alanine N-acetyltransferase [Clostridia bacterium]|nr:ribosomal protein S18-alanine N-acetyltransferase [Clostridia bacterium]
MNLLISKMNLNDLNSIKEILTSDFDDFWNYNILKQELECNNSHFIVVKNENFEILGFAGLKIIIDEADIMNIVVKKNFRNKGIGSFLLDNLISFSKNLNLNVITLEVSEKNLTAISLYENFGFEKLGIRKNYYDNSDGFIMSKKL